jgi:hypothetical protein
MRFSPVKPLVAGVALACLLVACKEEKPGVRVALSASAAALPAPAARPFGIDSASSRLSFVMDSPLEKIHGEAAGAVSGELLVDLAEITRTTGTIVVDLDRLKLSQERRKDEKQKFSESKENEKQNQEAREWLQLEAREGEIAEEQAKRNRRPEFRVERIENPSATDIQGLVGAQRAVGLTAVGNLLLHGRTSRKKQRLELVFDYSGDQITQVHVKTAEPLRVSLEEHDVNPRSRAGRLLKPLADALAREYDKRITAEVPVEIEFTARPK